MLAGLSPEPPTGGNLPVGTLPMRSKSASRKASLFGKTVFRWLRFSLVSTRLSRRCVRGRKAMSSGSQRDEWRCAIDWIEAEHVVYEGPKWDDAEDDAMGAEGW